MTLAYEFSTEVTDSGALIVPTRYRTELSAGSPVRVIILTDETNGTNGRVVHDKIIVEHNVHNNGEAETTPDDLLSLEEIVVKIQRMGPNLNNVTPAGGKLAEKLARLIQEEKDDDFNLELWQKEWDRIEAQMEVDELAHEAAEWKESNL